MIAIILTTVPLVIMLCVVAYRLATFALPFMLALETARFAYATGAGWIGAGIVGSFAGVASFGILAFLFATLRAPFPAPRRGVGLRRPRRRRGLCVGAWCHARSSPFRSLAANLLYRGRHVRRLFGAGEAGRSIHLRRGSLKQIFLT